MRKILLILLIFNFSLVSSQIYTSRTIEIEPGQMDKFIESAGKKTEKFNQNENNFAYYTFNILSGEDTGKIFRVQVGTPEMMDAGLNQDEASYWNKNVGPYIKSNSAGRTVMWGRYAEASVVPESSNNNDLRMVMFYNYKDSGEQDFWRFRERQAKARAAMEEQLDSAMNVMVCSSGCGGNWVAIFFSYESFEQQREINNEGLPKLVEKYNEMFGGGSYEQDVNAVNESLMPNGRRIVHMNLIREASSN
jgi:hypothetical protein